MRWRRPECYSDSDSRIAYELDPKLLEYTLESITTRNEHHDFELFCRHLCQRAICPNLRPATGPEGGGDGKVDTETYPVSEDIAALTYVGTPQPGNERWAFAFSAKKQWAAKVRSDVEQIILTERGYDRIICVTAQAARSKARLELEDELTKKYGVPVTVHDRAWVCSEIVEKGRIDLAVNYLSVGKEVSDSRLGPSDYARTQQLADIEATLDDPSAFEGLEGQRVTEALVAAKLSRNMERPRHETDGRFQRAIRLAEQNGSYYQKLRAKYEFIWTEYWWFDDFDFLQASFEEFESLALESSNTQDLQLLANVIQLFVNAVLFDHLSPEQAKIDDRYSPLVSALTTIKEDSERPNGALDAELILLLIELNFTLVNEPGASLSAFWPRFTGLVERAQGLGEFQFDKLEGLIDSIGPSASQDKEFNHLVEKLAESVRERKGEAEAGLLLLKRAQQIDFDENFEMIRLLGKAVHSLSKKEYADSLIEALQALMLAYKSAGLLWAARGSCIFASASIVIEDEDISQVRASIIPTIKTWAWIALELCHVPDYLQCIVLLNGMRKTLPLADESKARMDEDLSDLDAAFAARIAILPSAQLNQLRSLPDILEGLALFVSRTALLYRLGYEDLLREDGSIPDIETPEEVHSFFGQLANAAAAQLRPCELIANADEAEAVYRSQVIGLEIKIECGGSECQLLVAEMILASIEAFFTTAVEHKIGAHTESVGLRLIETQGERPTIDLDIETMRGTISWPEGRRPCDFTFSDESRKFQYEICATVLAAACVGPSLGEAVKAMFESDLVAERLTTILFIGNSYNRFARRFISRLSDWNEHQPESYDIKDARPILDVEADEGEAKFRESRTDEPGSYRVKSHDDLAVQSVINVHLWNRATWRGNLYMTVGSPAPKYPPYLCLCFENGDAGRKIFEGWRERFGESDDGNQIYLAIVRNFAAERPYDYKVLVTSGRPRLVDASRLVSIPSRIHEMNPASSENLERFLTDLNVVGSYWLLPATFENGEPRIFEDLAIKKNALSVKDASEVTDHDLEWMAIHAPSGQPVNIDESEDANG